MLSRLVLISRTRRPLPRYNLRHRRPSQSFGGALALLRRVVDRGATFIDTAEPYGPGISETLIAKALYPYPAGLVVATKGGLTRPGANRWVADCRPEHLRCACADSLRRLRLERIELYQLHAVDHRIPIEDSVRFAVPTIYDWREFAELGGLISYGEPNRRVAPGLALMSAGFSPVPNPVTCWPLTLAVILERHLRLGDRSSRRSSPACRRHGPTC